MDKEREFIKDMPKAKGKEELLKHLMRGERLTEGLTTRLTIRRAVIAKCYDCCGYYQDGKKDCEVPECPLHPFMPYREGGIVKLRTVTDEQRKEAGDRLRKARAKRADFSSGGQQDQCASK